jgi:hypothetical protein
MSQPGAIGHGVPPRPNDVQRELRDLHRQIDQMHGMIVQAVNAANAAKTMGRGFQQDVNSVDLPSDNQFHPYCATSPITVPDTYGFALVIVVAAAGTTFSGAGNISVVPTFNGNTFGHAVDTGVPAASPCSSFSVFSSAMIVTPGDTLTFAAMVATNGAQPAGAGNVHVSGTISFSR